MKKKWIISGAFIVMLLLFHLSPLAPYVKSLAVMMVYSHMNEEESLLKEKGIKIEIPGGFVTKEKDWYPFVMTYNAGDSFGTFAADRSLKLTILYNFAAFDLGKGCSRIYDYTSPYYNGFYGAYAVNGRYGFDEKGNIDCRLISQVPEFDFRSLVLEDLGLPRYEGVFEWEIENIENDISYAGYHYWTCVDAVLTVNGVLHEKKENLLNYIQYGEPNYPLEQNAEFAPVDMKGRVYARYFEERDLSIFFYIMVREEETLDKCDKEILQKSIIKTRG